MIGDWGSENSSKTEKCFSVHRISVFMYSSFFACLSVSA